MMVQKPKANRDSQGKSLGLLALVLIVAVLLPLTIGLVANRQDGPSSPEPVTQNTSSEDGSGAPAVDVTPDWPLSTDNLICFTDNASGSGADGQTTLSYAWYKDSVLQPQLTGSVVNSSYTTRGEVWKCVVTARDGAGAISTAFDEVTIHNTPPTAPAVDVTPDLPTATDSLLCSVIVPSTDADGDTVTYACAWYKNGVLQSELNGDSVNASYAGEGITWRCVVTASDGAGGTATAYDQVGTPPAARDPGTLETLFEYGTAWRWLSNDSGSASARAQIIAACQDSGINTILVAMDQSLWSWMTDNPATVAANMKIFADSGINLYASWNNSQDYISAGWDDMVDGHSMHQFIDLILGWNYNHPDPDQKWKGIHFDLEPLDTAHGGGTDAVNEAHLELVATTFTAMRVHTVDGETIDDQGLPVMMFADARYGTTLCAPAWGRVLNLIDVAQIEHYRWGGEGYDDGIAFPVAYAANVLANTVEMNRYFTVCVSCDELPKNYELADPYYSCFQKGREFYNAQKAALAAYYSEAYPAYYRGQDNYHWSGGLYAYYAITRVTSYPTGTKSPPDTLTISYSTFRLNERYDNRVFGVQMEFRDSAGTITETNQIIDIQQGYSPTNRTISVTIPADAANGAASVRLTLWAVSWTDENYYDKLWYGDYSGHQSELLAMTMDQLAATTTGPKGTLQGKRSTFFILQDFGWQSGITLT